MKVKKGNTMETTALALMLLVRVLLPASLLIAFGEWIRRRKKTYRLPR
jgi:hypothetical protein